MKKGFLLFVLKSIAILPLGFLYLIADFIAVILQYVAGYRKKVVRNNLTTSFPDKSLKEIKKIEREFYRFLSDQIIETLKLLHISDKEMKKRVEVVNYEEINNSIEKGKSAVILMGHYGNWEWVQEIGRYFSLLAYQASIYHPLSNPVWNDIFVKLRSRWGAHILPMKKTARTLLDKRNQPWVCGFIADAFTGYKHDDNWIEFLNHKTWFIYGPEEIGAKTGADFFYLDMHIEGRGKYKIEFRKLIPQDESQPYPLCRQFWREFQKTIERQPAYWLWSHKRWK
ncbi:MAG: lysophospholipid acyltransferase family protein [Muribaculaceae bacterium]|nr:lysophospholipid acyltransferase family protein [Muribaculaceae bacterium]